MHDEFVMGNEAIALGALAAGEPLPEPRTIVLNAEINVRDSI